MHASPRYTNHVENRLIDLIDWKRHLESEAEAWMSARAQRHYEERQALYHTRALAFQEPVAVR